MRLPQPIHGRCISVSSVHGDSVSVQATAVQYTDGRVDDASVHEPPQVYLGDDGLTAAQVRPVSCLGGGPTSLHTLASGHGPGAATAAHDTAAHTGPLSPRAALRFAVTALLTSTSGGGLRFGLQQH
jgi:hypothetical protein